MSQQIICDKCQDVMDEGKLFAILTITSVPTTDKASMDLCQDCFNEIVRSSKKWTYEESKFFPNSFGLRVLPKTSPESVPEPAEPAGVGILAMDSSVPPSASEPSWAPAPPTSPEPSAPCEGE